MNQITIQEIQSKQLLLMKEMHAFLQRNKIPYYLIGGSALGAVRHKGFIPWDDDIDIGMFREDYERFLKIANEFSMDYDIANFHNSKHCDHCLTRIYFPNTYMEEAAIQNTCLDKRLYFDIFPLDNVPEDTEERSKFEKRIRKKKALIAKIDVRDYHNPRIVLCVKKAISLCLRPFRSAILRQTDELMKKYRYHETTLICSLSSQYSFQKQVMNKAVYGKPQLHVFEDTEFYIPEQIDNYLTTLFGADYMQAPPENKRRQTHAVFVINKE